MKAITVEPKKAGTARYMEMSEPDMRDGSILVEAIAVGVCGTDVEIMEGKYGWAPPGTTISYSWPLIAWSCYRSGYVKRI
jgi:glucose 1-dehydrogenase